MKKWIQSAVAGTALVMFTQGAVAANQGFYIGLGAAKGFVSGSGNSMDLDSDVGYSGIFGYRLGIIPLFDFAAEGFYNDFGEFTPKDGSTNVSAKSWAYGANALAILVVGPVDFYGKVGDRKRHEYHVRQHDPGIWIGYRLSPEFARVSVAGRLLRHKEEHWR
jgi:hypothetical protein